MRLPSVLAVFLVLLFASPAYADLCASVQDSVTTAGSKNEVAFYEQLFPDTQYHGNRTWNEMVIQCNRQRDNKGNEVGKVTAVQESDAGKNLLQRRDLASKVVRGHYNFFGVLPFRLNYVYVLSKATGEWTMTIPYVAIFNEQAPNRVDFFVGWRKIIDEAANILAAPRHDDHAWHLYERSQVDFGAASSTGGRTPTLKTGAQPIAVTLCSNTTFLAGAAHKYDGQNDANAYKRDKENKFVDKGKIQYRYKDQNSITEGCRVDKNVALFWRDSGSGRLIEAKPQDWILDNFVRTVEAYWSIPGTFQLRLLLRGRNDAQFPQDTLKVLETGDRLTIRFATKFLPYHYNQMYKSNLIQFNNFSTMTTDGTYWHESGHAFGLDDEYGGEEDGKKPNDCHDPAYAKFAPTTYQMCDTGTTDRRTIYHYIAVSRYVTDQNECDADSDCEGGYCDKGVLTVGKNQCVALKADNATCDIVGGDRQCASGECSTYGRCYTKGAVAAGGTCYTDVACGAGKCSAVDGFRGSCVCQNDGDCGADQWCDAGFDTKQNACRVKLAAGASCGKVGSVGNDHKCKSGQCSGFPKYVCR